MMYNQEEDLEANSKQQPLLEVPDGVIPIEEFNKLYEEGGK